MDALINLECYDTFKMVIEEIIKTIYKSESSPVLGVESNIIENAKEDLRKLFISNNFNFNKVTEEIKNTGWDDQKINLFISVIEENKRFLLYQMLIRHNSMHGDTVVDHYWCIKLILGTSEFKSLRYPLLQIVLSTINSSGESTQRLYDLSRESLFKLITVMENCLGIN